MEQRDAIVKNLRDISKYFISENQVCAQEMEIKKAAFNAPSLNQRANNHDKRKSSGDTAKNNDVDIQPKENIYVFNSPSALPVVQYVLHDDDPYKINSYMLNISAELAVSGYKPCVVGSIDSVKQIIANLPDGFILIESKKDGADAEIFYIKPRLAKTPVILIGRQNSQWNAQINRYVEGLRTVFITDFSVNAIRDVSTGDQSAYVIFFSQPEVEKAFKVYLNIKKLISLNNNLFPALIVNNILSLTDADKVYNSFSHMLDKFCSKTIHYLGVLADDKNGGYLDVFEHSAHNYSNKNGFIQIAANIISYIPFIAVGKNG